MGMSGKKWLSGLLILLSVVFVSGVGLLIYFAPLIDISYYQKDLAVLLSQTLQRKFELDEKLFIKLGLKPTVVTGRLAISNPEWCKTPYLLQTEQAELGVDLLDLLRDRITIDRLVLKRARLNLEQDTGRNNWSFGKPEKTPAGGARPGSPVRLDYAVLDGVDIDYYSPKLHKQLHIKHALFKKNIRRRYKLDFEGELGKQKLLIQAGSNRWFDIQDIRPLNLELDIRLGVNRLSAGIDIQQLVPRLQANIKLESGKLDVDNLLGLFPERKQTDKDTRDLTFLDPWLDKIDNVSLALNIDKLLYSHFEIRDFSLQNSIIQDVSQKDAVFAVKGTGKAGQIINKKPGEAGLSPAAGNRRPGQASFSLTSRANTLAQLLYGAEIELRAKNLSGNYFRPYLINHIQLAGDAEKGLRATGEMTYNDTPVDFDIHTGKAFLEGLYQHGTAQLELALGTGNSKVMINTSGRELFTPGRRKIRLRLSGDHLAAWEPVFGRKLYKLERYRLDGAMELRAKGIKVNGFTLTTPDSDLKGKLFYRYGKRATLDARLENSRLKWSDLNKQVNTPVSAQKTPPQKPKENVMVIPRTDLMDMLSPKIDVNLVVKSSEVVFSKFSVKGLDLNIRWQDKVLAAQIEKGRLSAGALTADVYLTVVDNEAAGKIEIHVRQMDYGRLMQDLGLGDKMKGKADINIHLVGFGRDFKAFLTHSDGTAEFVGEKGILVSKYLRLWGEDLVQQILPFNWFDKEQTKMNCVVGRFDLTDGRLSSDSLLLDTEDLTIAGTGAISLATEELAFELMPDPKNISLISLATPVKIRGTLANPRIEPHTLGTTWTIGSLLVGLANPAVLIARFAKLGSLGENPCLAAIGKKEGEETSVLKAFKDAVKFIQRPLDRLPDID